MPVGSPPDAPPPLLAVVGPTACGKTEWALELAARLDGEVIGADSRQVYRGLDIGTAKPSAAQRAAVRHHCLDHVDPRERYHLARFLREARAALDDVRARGRVPIVAGGTGQYVWALLEGWDIPEVAPDPGFRTELEARARRDGAAALHDELRRVDAKAAEAILPGNARRTIRALEVLRRTGRPISDWWAARQPIPAVILAPEVDAAELDARIDRRVEAMFAAGLVEETAALLRDGLPPDAPALESIGYRQAVAHLAGESDRAAAVAATQQATRRLARRQRGWFRAADDRIRWAPTLAAALEGVAGVASASDAGRPHTAGLPTIGT